MKSEGLSDSAHKSGQAPICLNPPLTPTMPGSMDSGSAASSSLGFDPAPVESGTVPARMRVPLLRRLTSAAAKLLPPRRDPEYGYYDVQDNEEVRANLWSIYISEAEKYDSELVESWRSDMEGMLIFVRVHQLLFFHPLKRPKSGLFSASLTAFLIESYKTLQPDSGDLTVQAIQQVSRQLAALANGTLFAIPASAPFHPTHESLWCNALWFISLCLSLTCALLATLVEQWAREFLHKTEMRPSPVRRARIFSFAYFGLKRFRMHTVVDVIPFLLHASLLLFFAGLIAFLFPVNPIIMYLMCISLGIFIVLYAVLTILPVVYLDCPYRTPLSMPLWAVVRRITSILSENSHPTVDDTLMEAVVDRAMQNTRERDQHAIQWTLDSCTDDTELLPFLEAIVDVIHGERGFRGVNDYLFHHILGDVNMDTASPLVFRICGMLIGTDLLPLDDPLRTRRRTACLKALWALCMIPSSTTRPFNFSSVDFRLHHGSLELKYQLTTLLAIHFQNHMHHFYLLRTLQNLLLDWDNSPQDPRTSSAIKRTIRLLREFQPFRSDLILSDEIGGNLHRLSLDSLPALPLSASTLKDAQNRLASVLDSPQWSYHKLDMVSSFLQRALEEFAYHELATEVETFEPLSTCYAILSCVVPTPLADYPPRRFIDLENISLNHAPTEEHRLFLDKLAHITFHSTLLPFINGYPPPFMYLINQRSRAASRFVLQSTDLRYLAHSMRGYLRHSYREAVHSAVAVMNSITEDEDAIDFVDDVFAGGAMEIPRELKAAQYIRSLRRFSMELAAVSLPSVPDKHAQLQALCQDELLQPLSPIFLPWPLDAERLFVTLEIEFLHLHLAFLTEFLVDCNSSVWTDMYPFDLVGVYLIHLNDWKVVDPEAQNSFFAAVLEFSKQMLRNTDPETRLEHVAEQLWSSYLFPTGRRANWEVHGADIALQPSCLRMMLESLEIFLEVAILLTEERRVDTGPATKLAEGVRRRLQQAQDEAVVSRDDHEIEEQSHTDEVEGARSESSDDHKVKEESATDTVEGARSESRDTHEVKKASVTEAAEGVQSVLGGNHEVDEDSATDAVKGAQSASRDNHEVEEESAMDAVEGAQSLSSIER